MQRVEGVGEPSGDARQLLGEGVAFLDPEPAVFEAMLGGWGRQQRVRFLRGETVSRREDLVRRLARFSGQYPWEWSAAEVEAFIDHLRSGEHPIVVSTARGYLSSLQIFLGYVTDPRYGWVQVCLERFGRAPEQVLGDWNTIAHVAPYEGRPGRRPLSYDEVQALFDAADGLVEEIRSRGRKGALAAQRDATALKTIYAFGLRRREAWGLDLADLRRNPKVPDFDRFGALFVRWGKSSRGGPPKRRTVLLVPEMDWVVPVLEHWLQEVRPRLAPGQHPALFPTERQGRLSTRGFNEAFVAARDAAGLDPVLDLHCLRHSYVTHVIEFDYPERFVQDQVGHAYASTTALHTGVSDEYRNRLLRRALLAQEPPLWEDRS